MSIGTMSKNRTCISYGSNALTGSLEYLQGLILEDARSGTVQCPHNQCCFGIWNLTEGQLQVLVQGCWTKENKPSDSPACEPQAIPGMSACTCCSDLCNANISYMVSGRRQVELLPHPSWTTWILAACLVLLFLGCLVFLVLKRWKIPAAQLSSEATLELTKVTSGPEQKGRRELPKHELPDLQFLQILHHGQFSKLWQGTFKQQPVAIKAFPPLCHWQFESEWAVHSLPLMNHDNVIQLVAARCGGPSMEQGGLLVLTLYPLGSLRNFLSQHVCSWDITLRLGSSLARGLAFLHEEQWKEGLHKPGVAHRDLSSQNVLVREDWTSVISDFGLAVTLPESLKQWREDPAEHIVRTAEPPHYVAPEILDENLNLKDLGMALRQADVYSLALVLWEMFMRCSALFPEGATPEFQRAYEAELGSSPTHSELWSLAVEERQRPAIPTAWKSFGQVWQARGACACFACHSVDEPIVDPPGARGRDPQSPWCSPQRLLLGCRSS
uniref:receptor protein serine/threonine kinase n=1 Tax=Pogona vitticeps TaxID=103695 RepID=A0ABM5FP69_9SAUR